jgi:hypothetical protein
MDLRKILDNAGPVNETWVLSDGEISINMDRSFVQYVLDHEMLQFRVNNAIIFLSKADFQMMKRKFK